MGGEALLVSTGGKRNEKELTNDQINEATAYAVLLGMPADRTYYVGYDFTAYGYIFDVLRIGTDVLPLDTRVKNPNSNISMKGAIAHEVVGHREAAMSGLTQSEDLLEEVQASIRAARFAPGLSKIEQSDLIRDAIFRLKENNIAIRSVKEMLHIKER